MNKNLIITIAVLSMIGIALLLFLNLDTSDSSEQSTQLTNYVDYSDEALNIAQQNGSSLLFFHASWCPTCRALNKEIIDNHENIPEGITILKVDYDSENKLKDLYSVSTQHTLVFLGPDGEKVKSWVGGGFTTILQQLEGI